MADLLPIVAEIIEHVDDDEYVIPAQQFADPPFNQKPRDYSQQAGDGKTIWRMTRRIGRRAGIPAPVSPHMMRHAFADHVARFSGLREAQAMLGHAEVSTTQGYLGETRLDDLADAVRGVTFLGMNSASLGGGMAGHLIGSNRRPVYLVSHASRREVSKAQPGARPNRG